MTMKPMDSVAELPEVDESAALSAAACLFRSFGDPARLAILRHLAIGDHRVVDLTAHLGLAQSTVSAHLACLRDCGLVESRPQGRASPLASQVLEIELDVGKLGHYSLPTTSPRGRNSS